MECRSGLSVAADLIRTRRRFSGRVVLNDEGVCTENALAGYKKPKPMTPASRALLVSTASDGTRLSARRSSEWEGVVDEHVRRYCGFSVLCGLSSFRGIHGGKNCAFQTYLWSTRR